MKKKIILSVDYELFGDGSGCIDHCILKPCQQMADIAEHHGAFLSLFVEVMEFKALEQHKPLDIAAIKQQLNSLFSRQHDIQLHLHPQWDGASINEKQQWHLDNSKWRIGDLDYQTITDYLCSGKAWLEEVLAANTKPYQCTAFRAGGWCIQPSEQIVRALLDQGFSMDSSVSPQMREQTFGQWYDFSSVKPQAGWRCDNDVCVASQSVQKSLYELPIASKKIAILKHLSILLATRWQGGLASACVGSYAGPTIKSASKLSTPFISMQQKLIKLKKLGRVMLDLSTMPADVLIDITKTWSEQTMNSSVNFSASASASCSCSCPSSSYCPTHFYPIVAIAHTKNFTSRSAQALHDYLAWAKAEHYQFTTYNDWINDVANPTEMR